MHITCFFLVKSKRDLRYYKVWLLYRISVRLWQKRHINQDVKLGRLYGLSPLGRTCCVNLSFVVYDHFRRPIDQQSPPFLKEDLGRFANPRGAKLN